MLFDCCRLGVALALGFDDLFFGQSDQEPVRVLRIANGEHVGGVDFVQDGDLGWQPAESFASGLKKTVQWYLANGDWVKKVTSGTYADWVKKNYAARS